MPADGYHIEDFEFRLTNGLNLPAEIATGTGWFPVYVIPAPWVQVVILWAKRR